MQWAYVVRVCVGVPSAPMQPSARCGRVQCARAWAHKRARLCVREREHVCACLAPRERVHTRRAPAAPRAQGTLVLDCMLADVVDVVCHPFQAECCVLGRNGTLQRCVRAYVCDGWGGGR